MTETEQNDEWARFRKARARLFLIDAHNAKLTAKTIETEISEVTEDIDGLKAVDYSRDKVAATATDDGIVNLIVRKESLIGEYQAERERHMQLNADAHSALSKISEPGRSILTLKYMCDKRWCEVVDELEESGQVYSEDYVRKELHDAALLELFPHIPFGYNELPEAI